MRGAAVACFRRHQDRICDLLEARETSAVRFVHDAWERPGGGGGETRVLEGGATFEKAAVNFSEVHGELEPDFAARLAGDGLAFWAAGISLILHPRNPYVPTVHANLRRIERGAATWFGGGVDLTPYYPYEADIVHFHRTLKAACDATDPELYPRFKPWCDRYFFLPHRDEHRGVGGIFFDDLAAGDRHDEATLLAFVDRVGDAFADAYLPIVDRRAGHAFGERERRFQAMRRGRYVEFNLLYDRGTRFGLETGGRAESILVSLPPVVHWEYDYAPEPGSPEAGLSEVLKPRDWAG